MTTKAAPRLRPTRRSRACLGSITTRTASTGMMPLSVAPLYRLARRRGRRAIRTHPCTTFLGKTLTYREIGETGGARHARVAAARRTQGHQGRSVPAELADLHRLLLRRAEGRRDGRQLQPSLHRRRADAAGEGQRHRADGDARLAGAVRQGRGAARSGMPEARRRLLLPGAAAGDQGRRCSGCSSRRIWRGRWPRRRARRSSSKPR